MRWGLLKTLYAWVTVLWALPAVGQVVFAQASHRGLSGTAIPAPGEIAGIETTVKAGERLSDWILRQQPGEDPYLIGLIWAVPGEQARQGATKRALLAELRANPKVSAPALLRIKTMIESLPVTGRVVLRKSDPRWLQAHPQSDPILKADHALTLPQRPATVIVLTGEGEGCEVLQRSGRQARDYLQDCTPTRVGQDARAWVIQPDGSVSAVGIASWNQQEQPELAPGAVIWAPGATWSPLFSKLFAQFLATQSYATLKSLAGLKAVDPANSPPRPARSSARDLPRTSNDFGLIGLLQTPSARMAPAGDVRFHYSRVEPYERANIFLQPFDALEVGFRYTNVLNRPYGPPELSGDQTFKDKSIDFKIRLVPESTYLPQMALGITDVGGTGLFSSEYLVASKRFHAFDFSLGIGWGYLAKSATISNPLGVLDERFNTRGGGSGFGGTPNTSAFFRGPSALFGGVQYHTPWDSWIVKAEYEGNDYLKEPLANTIAQRSPLNFGVVYRFSPLVDFSLGIERGNALMLGFTLHTSLSRMRAPKISDPPQLPPDARPASDVISWAATAADVQAMSGWGVRQIQLDANTLRIFVDPATGAHWTDRVERITAVLNRDAPDTVHTFELVVLEQGMPITRRLIDRRAWIRKSTELLPPSQSQAVTATAEALRPPSSGVGSLWDRPSSNFGLGIVPTLQQNFGGPNNFLLFGLGAALPFRISLAEHTAISGAMNLRLVDNFEKFTYTANSDLPRVRTYLREYMTSSAVTLPHLQVTHVAQFSKNHFYSAYAGYLETMYGGVGGEWLYRPWHSPLAVGIDVNRVQQRSFRQSFDFSKAGSQTGYRVNTGHATLYWDTGWQSTLVKLSAGRYLAGDIGATLDLSKTFSNGVVMGAWATKSDVPAEKFGEGSFDKGLYLRIPFDVMTTTRTGNVANLVYSPLTRDGGARLNRHYSLYHATAGRSERETSFEPASETSR